jgi:hypothetical protein
MGRKYEQRVEARLGQEEHQWVKGLSPEEAEKLRQVYQQ